MIHSGLLSGGLTIGVANLLASGSSESAYWLTHTLIVTFPVALWCAWQLSKKCTHANVARRKEQAIPGKDN